MSSPSFSTFVLLFVTLFFLAILPSEAKKHNKEEEKTDQFTDEDLSFDHLPPPAPTGTIVPNGHAELQWSHISYAAAASLGHLQLAHSLPNVGFTSDDNTASFSSTTGDEFAFVSAWMAIDTKSSSPVKATVRGFKGARLVWIKEVELTEISTFTSMDRKRVDTITFSRPFIGSSKPYVIFDNIKLEQVSSGGKELI